MTTAAELDPAPKLGAYAHPERLVTTAWLAEHLGRPQPGGGRVGRGRPAVRDRAHPGRGQDRLAPGPERPGRAGLRERRGLRPADVVQGHRPRHHRRVLRRQLQLVGRLRPVGVDPVRPPGRAAAGRRPPEVGGRGPAPDHRRPPAPGRRLPGGGAGRHRPSAPSATRSSSTSAAAGGWSTCARPASTRASCWPCPTTPRRGRCAAATSPARPTCPGSGRPTRTAPSSRPTSCGPSTRASSASAADDDIVAYCRIGERSSHTWFVLSQLLGFQQVRNYDGSWVEWGNSVRVPIERSSEPGPDPRLKAVG